MTGGSFIEGFSSLSREEKLAWLQAGGKLSQESVRWLEEHRHPDPAWQDLYASFSENNLSDYHLPLGLAPNFLVNGTWHSLPMVTEESSVVAAAAKAAKFWARHGGFRARVLGTEKLGQIHFRWTGSEPDLDHFFAHIKPALLAGGEPYGSHGKRAGIRDISLRSLGPEFPQVFQVMVTAKPPMPWCRQLHQHPFWKPWRRPWRRHGTGTGQRTGNPHGHPVRLPPGSRVECRVHRPRGRLPSPGRGGTGRTLPVASPAVRIASLDPLHRAFTGKGIFNGMDALILATGNDFRAVEACGPGRRDGRPPSPEPGRGEGRHLPFQSGSPPGPGHRGRTHKKSSPGPGCP
ncbi:MAG: hypothetical protein R2751_14140 [Bacteroidales bacterium]